MLFFARREKYALNNKYLQALGINSQEKTIVQIYKHNMDTYQQWQEITNTTFATSKTKQVHYHFRDFRENNHDVLSQCTSKNSYPGHKKRSTHSRVKKGEVHKSQVLMPASNQLQEYPRDRHLSQPAIEFSKVKAKHEELQIYVLLNRQLRNEPFKQR